MGTAVKSKKEEIDIVRKNDIYSQYVNPEIYKKLRMIYPEEFIPKLSRTELESSKTRYQQALELPVAVDHIETKRTFGCTSTDQIDLSVICDHYSKGLITKAILGKRLGFTEDEIFTPQCALGYKLVSHHSTEEFGLSMTEDKIFPKWVVETYILLTIRRFEEAIKTNPTTLSDLDLNNYTKVRCSLPRGKNTGLPIIAPGSDRLMSDMVMSLDAGLAAAMIRSPQLFHRFKTELLTAYIVFSRYQNSGNIIPMHVKGTNYSSQFLEPRRRLINAAPKAITMMIKPWVKWWTTVFMLTPEGCQDRDYIHRYVTEAKYLYAVDSSRFDLHLGDVKLQQALTAMFTVTKHFFPNLSDDLLNFIIEESRLPKFVDTDLDAGVMRIAQSHALNSGSGSTSIAGSAMNEMCMICNIGDCIGVRQPEKLLSYLLPGVMLVSGDDNCSRGVGPLAKMVTKADLIRQLDLTNIKLGVDMAQEHPDKFLGMLFNLATYSGVDLYHTSNSLGNMLFPERPRTNAVASLLSRYLICKNRRVHDAYEAITNMMRDVNYLKSVHRNFMAEVYPIIKPHFSSHPNGAMKAYFNTFPIDLQIDGNKLQKQLYKDIDEILYIYGHGAEFDVNTSLLGLDFIEQRDEVVTASIDEALDVYLSKVLDADQNTLTKRRGQFGNLQEMIRRIGSWFAETSPEGFFNRFMTESPFIFRKVTTDYGYFFTTKF